MKTLLVCVLFAMPAIALCQSTNPAPEVSLINAYVSMHPFGDNDEFMHAASGFNLNIRAAGTDGPDGVSPDYTFTKDSFSFAVYKDGVKQGSVNAMTTTYFTVPSAGVVVLYPGTSFTLHSENQVALNVMFILSDDRDSPGLNGMGTYAIGLDTVTYSYVDGTTGNTVTESLTGLSDSLEWRTNSFMAGSGPGPGSAVPEPSTYAAIAGLTVLVIAYAVRRKSNQTSKVSSAG